MIGPKVDYFCALWRQFLRNYWRKRVIFVLIRGTGETRTAETTLTIFLSRIFLPAEPEQENAGQENVGGLYVGGAKIWIEARSQRHKW